MKYISVALILMFLSQVSCVTEITEPESQFGKLRLKMEFQVDGLQLLQATFGYINAAGNEYMVTEVQFFISDLKLYREDGTDFELTNWENIHYFDRDIPSTLEWTLYDKIEAGAYSAMAFTFGLTEERNQSFMFVNPPESLMFWPENLGGGYHYLKINGKWKDELGLQIPYNFHLGIGQIYHSYPDSITGFVHNYFMVVLPNSGFTINKNETREVTLVMNINNWFTNPNEFDFNVYGGQIMQNQEAMGIASENGWDVFYVK